MSGSFFKPSTNKVQVDSYGIGKKSTIPPPATNHGIKYIPITPLPDPWLWEYSYGKGLRRS
jgi:hypothetical protein